MREMLLLGFILLNLFHFSLCEFINEGDGDIFLQIAAEVLERYQETVLTSDECFMLYKVQMSVFSGRPDPSWKISKTNPLYARIAARLSRSKSTKMSDKLGYSGFAVDMTNSFGQRVRKTIGAGTNPRLELLLLNSSPYPIEKSVRRSVIDTIRRTTPLLPYTSLRPSTRRGPMLPYRRCRIPRFDPEKWNALPTFRRNNCYNYAMDIQTDTRAQPGRASGDVFSLPLTASSVLRGAISDGLIPLPFFDPMRFPRMCYTALVIWPGTDFHFYRLDSNMLWSHKPGRKRTRNTDESGDLILDPRFADRGNYVIFAGYLGNHPGVRII